MKKMKDTVKLIPLEDNDIEQFILDNQDAFNYGALVEFGRRDDHFEIILHMTIEHLIYGGEACRIMKDGKTVGGVIIKQEKKERFTIKKSWKKEVSIYPSG